MPAQRESTIKYLLASIQVHNAIRARAWCCNYGYPKSGHVLHYSYSMYINHTSRPAHPDHPRKAAPTKGTADEDSIGTPRSLPI